MSKKSAKTKKFMLEPLLGGVLHVSGVFACVVERSFTFAWEYGFIFVRVHSWECVSKLWGYRRAKRKPRDTAGHDAHYVVGRIERWEGLLYQAARQKGIICEIYETIRERIEFNHVARDRRLDRRRGGPR